MFAKVVEQGKTATAPVKDVIKHHWREILLSAGVRFAEQMPFYLFTTFVLIYVVQRHHYSKTFVLSAVLVGAAVELADDPVVLASVGLAWAESGYTRPAQSSRGCSRFRTSSC